MTAKYDVCVRGVEAIYNYRNLRPCPLRDTRARMCAQIACENDSELLLLCSVYF